MTLRQFLKQYEGYKDTLLDKELLIECPNGLLVSPVIKYRKQDIYGPNTTDNIVELVICPKD